MALNIEQQLLVEKRLANELRSGWIAYLFWFSIGFFGAHRFYLGRTGSGLVMLLLFWVGVFTVIFSVGFVLLLVLIIWWIVDAFLIPGMIDADRRARRAQIAKEIEATAGV